MDAYIVLSIRRKDTYCKPSMTAKDENRKESNEPAEGGQGKGAEVGTRVSTLWVQVAEQG